MPLLNDQDLAALHARPLETCGDCGQRVRWNYCRQHDEFFTVGHAAICPTLDTDRRTHNYHYGHRTY